MIDRDGSGSLEQEELVAGLRSVNKNLISPKELEYVQVVMHTATGNENAHASVGFELFSLMASLSERVVGLDSVVKRCIDSTDFEALRQKITKSKDLYFLNANKAGVMYGHLDM